MSPVAATRRLAVTLVSASLLAPGCSLYRVRSGEGRPLDGIPFFPHTGVCRQDTTYVQPVYRVVVQAISGNREITLFEAVLTATAIGSPEMHALRCVVTAADADPLRIGEAFVELTAPVTHRYGPLAPPMGLFLASNTASAESQVDYRAPLYLNASRPWIGSAGASARLAPDGTLAEATAEMKDATLDTLLSMVPAKDVLTALVSGERLRPFVGGTPQGAAALLQLVTEPQYVKHTYTTMTAAPCAAAASPIPAGSPGAMYRREQVTTTADAGRKP